jgi:hypothetical protein
LLIRLRQGTVNFYVCELSADNWSYRMTNCHIISIWVSKSLYKPLIGMSMYDYNLGLLIEVARILRNSTGEMITREGSNWKERLCRLASSVFGQS